MKSIKKKKLILLTKLAFIIIIILIFMIELFIFKPKINILLCSIAKNENKYILEFINHYRKMKFNKIILYDNNEINGEKFFNILTD